MGVVSNSIGTELSVNWGTDITYAVGGRSGIKCVGIIVSDNSYSDYIKVRPVNSLGRASSSIAISIPKDQSILSDIASLFINLCKRPRAVGPGSTNSLNEEVSNSAVIAKYIIKNQSAYKDFNTMEMEEFLASYTDVDVIAYNMIKLYSDIKGCTDEV